MLDIKREGTLIKHFVAFCSPGTLFSEITEKPIDKWDVDTAVTMAKSIIERHGAIPYGFYFITRGRSSTDLNSKVLKESGMYYLGGTTYTLAEIKARKDPNDKILISNMECNRWKKVIVNTNSYRVTLPLRKGDVVLKMGK